MAFEEVRCASCNKLLLKATGEQMSIEIKCHRCGAITNWRRTNPTRKNGQVYIPETVNKPALLPPVEDEPEFVDQPEGAYIEESSDPLTPAPRVGSKIKR